MTFFQPDEILSVSEIDENNTVAVRKYLNGLEDLGYAFTKMSDEERRACRQFIRNEKRVMLEKGLHKDQRYSDLTNMRIIKASIRSDEELDRAVFSLVTPVYRDTVFKFADWMKGKEAFYLLNSAMSLGDEEENTFFAKLLRNVTKSVNYEKVSRYALYFLSGWASKDFKKFADDIDVTKFKRKCEERLDQPLEGRSAKLEYDASLVGPDKKKYIGFAFSDTGSPESQGDQFYRAVAENRSDDVVYVYVAPGFFLQGHDDTTEFYGRKAQQHGKPFLNLFKDEDGESCLDSDALQKFNWLPLLSSFSNLTLPHPEYPGITPAAFVAMNPFIPGTDTYPLYQKFRDIRTEDEPARTKKLFGFMLEYAGEITSSLSGISRFDKKTAGNGMDDTRAIFRQTEALITGICKNFNPDTMGKEMTVKQKATLERVIKEYVAAARQCTTGANEIVENSVFTLLEKGRIGIEDVFEETRIRPPRGKLKC